MKINNKERVDGNVGLLLLLLALKRSPALRHVTLD